MKTQAIIFSRDRACQLDALVRSIDKYAPWLKPITVLWTWTSLIYQAGYVKLVHYPRLSWFFQSSFKQNLLTIMTPDIPQVMFLVDDDLFFQPLPEIDVPPGEGYAPRLGRNLQWCYMANCAQQLPKGLRRESLLDGDRDFDATLHLDGGIYRTADILPYFQKAEYANPNEIEGVLSGSIRFPLNFAEHSCLVGIPHNRVGPNAGNRNAGGSAEELNRRFLAGERIDIDRMDFSNVIGVHQEIPYEWKRA